MVAGMANNSNKLDYSNPKLTLTRHEAMVTLRDLGTPASDAAHDTHHAFKAAKQ
jgi:hypothetical protein